MFDVKKCAAALFAVGVSVLDREERWRCAGPTRFALPCFPLGAGGCFVAGEGPCFIVPSAGAAKRGTDGRSAYGEAAGEPLPGDAHLFRLRFRRFCRQIDPEQDNCATGQLWNRQRAAKYERDNGGKHGD